MSTCAAIATIPARWCRAAFRLDSVRRRAARVSARQRPAGTGRSHRRPAESADRAGHGESHLAASFRAGHRAHAQQLRRAGRAAHASRAARLSGRAASSREVVDEGDASRDHAFGGLPAERGLLAAEFRGRSGQPAAVARQPPAAGCGGAARPLLFVSGKLDLEAGRPAGDSSTTENHRRTVYGFVSRRKLDPMLALFDFPNPNSTSEQRMVTNVPLQGLFFMNSDSGGAAVAQLWPAAEGASR